MFCIFDSLRGKEKEEATAKENMDLPPLNYTLWRLMQRVDETIFFGRQVTLKNKRYSQRVLIPRNGQRKVELICFYFFRSCPKTSNLDIIQVFAKFSLKPKRYLNKTSAFLTISNRGGSFFPAEYLHWLRNNHNSALQNKFTFVVQMKRCLYRPWEC